MRPCSTSCEQLNAPSVVGTPGPVGRTTTLSPHEKSVRLPWLDGLRGIAVLMVLLHHFFPPLGPDELGGVHAYLLRAQHLTFTGVDLFFVISGFLIGGILMDHRASPHLMRTFYVRRALRILPLAWVFIAITFGLWAAGALVPIPHTPRASPGAWWANVFFAGNFVMAAQLDWGFRPLSLLWSLAVEEQFYLVVPWLMTRFARPETCAWTLIAAGVWSRVAVLAILPGASFATHVLPFCRADTLGAGVLAAWVLRDARAASLLQTHRKKWWLGWTLCAGAMALLTQLRSAPGDVIFASFGYSAIAGFYALTLLLIASSSHGGSRRILGGALLVRFGRYSYFIYLFQGMIYLAVSVLLASLLGAGSFRYHLVLALVVPFACLAVAAMSWRCFEQPLWRIAHRFSYD